MKMREALTNASLICLVLISTSFFPPTIHFSVLIVFGICTLHNAWQAIYNFLYVEDPELDENVASNGGQGDNKEEIIFCPRLIDSPPPVDSDKNQVETVEEGEDDCVIVESPHTWDINDEERHEAVEDVLTFRTGNKSQRGEEVGRNGILSITN